MAAPWTRAALQVWLLVLVLVLVRQRVAPL